MNVKRATHNRLSGYFEMASKIFIKYDKTNSELFSLLRYEISYLILTLVITYFQKYAKGPL